MRSTVWYRIRRDARTYLEHLFRCVQQRCKCCGYCAEDPAGRSRLRRRAGLVAGPAPPVSVRAAGIGACVRAAAGVGAGVRAGAGVRPPVSVPVSALSCCRRSCRSRRWRRSRPCLWTAATRLPRERSAAGFSRLCWLLHVSSPQPEAADQRSARSPRARECCQRRKMPRPSAGIGRMLLRRRACGGRSRDSR